MTVLSNGILAVKVEQGAIGFRIQKDFQEDGGAFQLFYRYNPVHVQDSIYLCDFKRIDLPSGNYKIIGPHSADKPLSEEQCRQLIDDCHFAYTDFTVEALNGDNIRLKSASESLESWMRANKVYVVNPYEKDAAYGKNINAYDQAQQRTGSFIFLKQIEV